MIKIEFELNQNITIIQADLKELFKNIINRFLQKAEIQPGAASFLANGKILNPEEALENQMNQINKESKSLKIIVNLIYAPKPGEKLIKSKDIICPECYEPCRIKIKNCKFKLYDCPNNHIIDDINISDFQRKQMIDMNKIICFNHKDNSKNMGNSYNNEFYKCLTCKTDICLLCKNKHDVSYNVVKFEQKIIYAQSVTVFLLNTANNVN